MIMATFVTISDPILDLTSAPLQDESIEEISWHEYRPQDPAARQQLEITILHSDVYTLPCEAYLQVCGKLVKAADGKDYAATDAIALVNNGVMALFSDVSYQINGMEIKAVRTNADIATTILGLVRYSYDYARTSGTLFHWAIDTSSDAD